jgi:hypothetical protein
MKNVTKKTTKKAAAAIKSFERMEIVNPLTATEFKVGQGFKAAGQTFKIVDVMRDVVLTPRDRDTSGRVVSVVTARSVDARNRVGDTLAQFHSYAPLATLTVAPFVKED